MNLSPEHEALRHLLLHPAWDGLYKKTLAERVKVCYSQLIDPSLERKNAAPDDFLRGFITALQWAVKWPDEELNTAVVAAMEAAANPPIEVGPLFGNIREGMANGQGSPDSASGSGI